MTKTKEQYEAEIKTLHNTIKEYGNIPEVTKLKASLDRKLSKWFELSDICIIVANNEQLPYTEEELAWAAELNKSITPEQKRESLQRSRRPDFDNTST